MRAEFNCSVLRLRLLGAGAGLLSTSPLRSLSAWAAASNGYHVAVPPIRARLPGSSHPATGVWAYEIRPLLTSLKTAPARSPWHMASKSRREPTVCRCTELSLT